MNDNLVVRYLDFFASRGLTFFCLGVFLVLAIPFFFLPAYISARQVGCYDREAAQVTLKALLLSAAAAFFVHWLIADLIFGGIVRQDEHSSYHWEIMKVFSLSVISFVVTYWLTFRRLSKRWAAKLGWSEPDRRAWVLAGALPGTFVVLTALAFWLMLGFAQYPD